METIPYGKQSINHADIEKVRDVLTSDWITQGPVIQHFEDAIASYCGANHAVAVSSATAALHLACLALELGSGDYLWTSPNSFVASANCALYCGAEVDFVDINLSTYNLCVDLLEEKLITAQREGKLPKILVCVHFAGQSCDMARIKALSEIYGFKIIEDASHAIGGMYKNKKIGACQYSDITVFSFHPVKIITTGEGGMLLTQNQTLYNKLLRLRTHGITRDESFMQNPIHGPWYYEQIDLGFNYRITDMQAALGLSQMQRIDDFISTRTAHVSHYNSQLTHLPLTLPFLDSDCVSAWHLYVVMLKLEELKHTRLKIFEIMREAKIQVNVHYIPIPSQPYYQLKGFDPSIYKNTAYYYERTLTLPLFPSMSLTDQKRIITTLEAALLCK